MRGGKSKVPSRKPGGAGGRDGKGTAAAGGDEPPRVVSRAVVLRERILVWDSARQRFVVVWCGLCVLCLCRVCVLCFVFCVIVFGVFCVIPGICVLCVCLAVCCMLGCVSLFRVFCFVFCVFMFCVFVYCVFVLYVLCFVHVFGCCLRFVFVWVCSYVFC